MFTFSNLRKFSLAVLLTAVIVPPKSEAVIQAYAAVSVAAGSQINFRVKSNAENFRILWYRYDLTESATEKIDDDDLLPFDSYRIPLHQVLNAGTFPVVPQANDDDYAYRDGCNWQITCSFDIPPDWPSDFYLAKLEDSFGHYCFVPVIVRSNSPGSQSKIANVSATNTWQAYNTYGGASFYDCVSSACTTGSPIVSYDRPLLNTTPAASGHLSGIEHLMIKFLKSHGVAYEQLSDRDLHDAASNGLLDNYDIVILSGHNEYWSAEMKEALESFLDRGGKLINLSGNTMFWRIAFDGNKIGRVARWRVLIPGGEFGILGAGYLGANCCPVCAGLEARRTHWIFNNTQIAEGSVFGSEGVNQHPNGCQDGSAGASGWEYDVIGPGSPPPCGNGLWTDCLDILAKGLNHNSNGTQNGMDMYLYHRGRGGYIFAAPSITFTGSLVVDSGLQQIVLNVIGRFLSNDIPGAEETCCSGRRGDLNGDGTEADLLDLNFAVNKIFRNGPSSGCPGEADLNGDGQNLNILDLSFLINKCFRGGPVPANCD